MEIVVSSGYSFTVQNSIFTPNVMYISGKNAKSILMIKSNGDVFYRFENKMVKVNCPDDITTAFLCSVFNCTGLQPEDAIIETYLNKMLDHDNSDIYMERIEKAFRRLKIITLNKLHTFQPVIKSRFELTFYNELLDDCVSKITDKYIFFNLNIVDNQIVPVYTINELILSNIDLNIKISISNKNGEILTFIYLENVNLLKIKNFIDFDYNKNSEFVKIKVRYNYKRQKVFKGINELICYQRKQKLEKISKN